MLLPKTRVLVGRSYLMLKITEKIAWRQCEVEPWLVKARLLFVVTNVHFAPDQDHRSVTKCKCAPWKARLLVLEKRSPFLRLPQDHYQHIWRFTCVLGHNQQIQRGRSTFPEGEPLARAATTPGWWLGSCCLGAFFKNEFSFSTSPFYSPPIARGPVHQLPQGLCQNPSSLFSSPTSLLTS